MKKKLIILAGPTGVGKTELSITLAKQIGGEIISADSMQVYRHMDIGSAKIKKEEMKGIPHYLIDCLSPFEEFSVRVFQDLAKEALEAVYAKGKVPIVVGGTGFYIQALLYDIDFTENDDNMEVRMELERIAQEKGAHFLHEMLGEIDSKAAEEIHENNVKRVIRAIEYYRLTNEKISEHNELQRQKESPYDASFFVLTDERERLYKNIDKRVDHMLAAGLVDEVKRLKDMGCHRNMVSMQGLGYKEILGYLDGEYDLDQAVYLIKRDTRHFAKRQLTWFRREKNVIWMDKRMFQYDEEKMIGFMVERILEGSG
ncbi:MAG: tRNA (adenosine(37)-N6)-dimethylallyltransferase MiaA [Lachnospiraceae bacterium]|nr:tRNA (adenosine(37)-N6)-dimethylallyltransferase MiaA [Lachnospiraceae bacterium]